jgi:hypothetical protein
MYGGLAVILAIAAVVLAAQYRAHRIDKAGDAQPWKWQSYYLLFMLAGFIASIFKLSFYCAYKWQQKAPELVSAPKSSPLAHALNARLWTVYALYRVIKPVSFAFTLAARVLILARMLSLISVGRSPRARRAVARVESAGLVFAALSSFVACLTMWASAVQTFDAAAAFARAADAAANNITAPSALLAAAAKDALAVAASKSESSTEWNSANNSFEVAFYALYSSSCAVITAAVLYTMRSLKRNIESQKLLLDDLSKESLGDACANDRASADSNRLISINDVADRKTQRLQAVLRKIALNCVVVLSTALFGMLFMSLNAAQGLQPSAPPPPCPAAAKACDSCELTTMQCDIHCICANFCCMQHAITVAAQLGEEVYGLDLDVLVIVLRLPTWCCWQTCIAARLSTTP